MNPYQPLRNVDVSCELAFASEQEWCNNRINNQTLLFVHDCVRTLVVCEVLSLSLGTAKSKRSKTLNSGYLGSRNDEERSEMRYVM